MSNEIERLNEFLIVTKVGDKAYELKNTATFARLILSEKEVYNLFVFVFYNVSGVLDYDAIKNL